MIQLCQFCQWFSLICLVKAVLRVGFPSEVQGIDLVSGRSCDNHVAVW